MTFRSIDASTDTSTYASADASADAISVEVSLEHSAIQDMEGYNAMNHGWRWAFDSFKSYHEIGEPIPYDEWEGSSSIIESKD